MIQKPRFIHLHLHSQYSLLEGAMRVAELPAMTAAADMPAVAVTDSNNMFCALEFSQAAAKAGVQPIIGCQIDLEFEPTEPGRHANDPAPIVLLAQNEQGYLNLIKLNSVLHVGNKHAVPHVGLEHLAAHHQGLICLSGGPDGPIGRLICRHQRRQAKALLRRLADIYPNRLYVELQRHPGATGLPKAESLTEQGQVALAYAMDLPLVATNDVYFPKSELYEAHDVLLCIADGAYVDQQEPRRHVTPQHYFKTPLEMVALFADLPEAVDNTIEIAKRCAFRVPARAPILPKFADDEVEELRRQAREGLRARLAVIPPAATMPEYEKRLESELAIIEGMGFPGYFLIVADIIKWAKAQGIPVGPGRGSGAGSLVAYALTITDLDPLRYSLLFERFLNPSRVSMPDFDIDFCMERRDEIIHYVQQKYGRDKVAQIITFGALLSRVAVRDVGRVLQMPYGQVDRLAKMIPMQGVKPMSIEQSLNEEPQLRTAAQSEEVVERLLTYARQIEGLMRNASTHAAGIVIADRPLEQLVPLYQDPRSDTPATQFHMKWVEQAGLVKFDFLGLKTLTVIHDAVELVQKSGRALHIAADGTQLFTPPQGMKNDISAIPLDDEKTFALYAQARTVGVFQVESAGMVDALRRMKPTCIDDIVALVALYRPGPMENIPAYCDVKNGRQPLHSIHPLIDDILASTQGIIVYQEQVMQIAQVMAGYSLGGADILRRAMGKKIASEMAKERPKFVAGAQKNGISKAKATAVFDLLEKFANYGFAKSHAACYAIVSYHTAWLKANHPVEFMAAVMNCDLHSTDKLAAYVHELKIGLDIECLPPCVNRSGAKFEVSEGKVIYALGALKNVGVAAMRLIVQARGRHAFTSLLDLARRVDLRKIGKRSLEMLARSGAFDTLDPNRRRVFESLEPLSAYSAAIVDQRTSGQGSLFGENADDLPAPRLPQVGDWLPAERLSEEFAAIGMYLSGHPLDDYKLPLRRVGAITLKELKAKAAQGPCKGMLAGTITGRKERKSARGNRYAFVQLSDPTGDYEVTVYADTLANVRDLLEVGTHVVLQVETSAETGPLRLRCQAMARADTVIANVGPAGLRLVLDRIAAVSAIAQVLKDAAHEQPSGGARGPVHLCLRALNLPGEVELDLGRQFPITPQVEAALKSLDGVMDIHGM